MESEVSLPCLQELISCPHSEPRVHLITSCYILILPSHLPLYMVICPFQGFRLKYMYFWSPFWSDYPNNVWGSTNFEATITNLNLYIVDDSHPVHLSLRVHRVYMLEFKRLNLLVGWSQGWIVRVGNLKELLHTPEHKLTPVFWSDNPHRSFHTQLPNDNYSCCSYGTDGSTSSLLTASTHAQMSSPAHLFFYSRVKSIKYPSTACSTHRQAVYKDSHSN
jgi:hypothetical protein